MLHLCSQYQIDDCKLVVKYLKELPHALAFQKELMSCTQSWTAEQTLVDTILEAIKSCSLLSICILVTLALRSSFFQMFALNTIATWQCKLLFCYEVYLQSSLISV